MSHATRYVLYPMLFVFSTILIGLTSARIHYTKRLSGGDILTTRSHYYDAKIVALLVVSILALLFSLVMLGLFAGNVGGLLVVEDLVLWGIWIFFLVTIALVTRQFSNLKWCRGFNQCRILEAIKAFGWICWGILTFLLIASLFDLLTKDRNNRGTTHHETREAPSTVAHTRPTTAQPTEGVPATQGDPTKRNTQPATAGPLYPVPGTNEPTQATPRHIV